MFFKAVRCWLSILIPSIPERVETLSKLITKLNSQIGDRPVELIVTLDNKKLTLADKRNSMMRMCHGLFITHLDDDDDVSNDYISTVLPFIRRHKKADVICIQSESNLGTGNTFIVRTSIEYENEQTIIIDGFRADIKRKPWHWCLWRCDIARRGKFPQTFYGEDWDWIQQILKHVKTEARLDKVLHFYKQEGAKADAEKEAKKCEESSAILSSETTATSTA